MHEGSGSDSANVREVGFLAVKHLERRLHLECLVRSPSLEIQSHHEQLPPYGRWEAAVYEHVPNHSAQSSPNAFGYIDSLRHVGGGEILDKTGLQAVRPELFPAVLAALVGAPTDVASAEEDERRPDEQSKRLKSLFVVSRQVNGGPPGVLVGRPTYVLVAAYGHWREGLSQDPAIQLERPDDLVGSCLGVGKLDCLPRGVNVTVQESPLEHHTSAVSIT